MKLWIAKVKLEASLLVLAPDRATAEVEVARNAVDCLFQEKIVQESLYVVTPHREVLEGGRGWTKSDTVFRDPSEGGHLPLWQALHVVDAAEEAAAQAERDRVSEIPQMPLFPEKTDA